MDLDQYFGSIKVYRDGTVIFEKSDLPIQNVGDMLEHFFYANATKIEVTLPDGSTRDLRFR